MRKTRELLALYMAQVCPCCEVGRLQRPIDQDLVGCPFCGFSLPGRDIRATEDLGEMIRQGVKFTQEAIEQ